MKIWWIVPDSLAASGIPLDEKDNRSLHGQGILRSDAHIAFLRAHERAWAAQ